MGPRRSPPVLRGAVASCPLVKGVKGEFGGGGVGGRCYVVVEWWNVVAMESVIIMVVSECWMVSEKTVGW